MSWSIVDVGRKVKGRKGDRGEEPTQSRLVIGVRNGRPSLVFEGGKVPQFHRVRLLATGWEKIGIISTLFAHNFGVALMSRLNRVWCPLLYGEVRSALRGQGYEGWVDAATRWV